MAKLTKSEFNQRGKSDQVMDEASEKDKKALITKVYNWQNTENIYAWDEESLQEELGLNINGFTLAGETESGVYTEIEFFQPLDENVVNEGVALGYRLIKVQDSFYTLQKYRKHHKKDAEDITEEEE